MRLIITVLSILFVWVALVIIRKSEEISERLFQIEMCEGTVIQNKQICPGAMWLSAVVIISTMLLNHSENMPVLMICSSVLLVIAIMDASTGYIYEFWTYVGIVFGAIVILFLPVPKININEMILMLVYVITIIVSGLFEGFGRGDVGIYLSLLLFYIMLTDLAAEMAIVMLFLSQVITGIMILFYRKRRIPLVPSIWLAHLITIFLFGF